MKIEHLKDHIWVTYHTDLKQVVQELGVFELDLEAAKAGLDELRQKIDQMGPINIDALQEYTELKERYEMLAGQQKDIDEAVANLKETIAKLDSETRELFTSAYHAIHEKFKEVFTLLFEGGKAELVLLDEQNILESGIEIIAQPRGKVPGHFAPLRRRARLDGDRAALCGVSRETKPLLHAGRGGCPP
jgi:chromosome segregation protein